MQLKRAFSLNLKSEPFQKLIIKTYFIVYIFFLSTRIKRFQTTTKKAFQILSFTLVVTLRFKTLILDVINAVLDSLLVYSFNDKSVWT